MKLRATLNGRRLASVVFFVTFALSGPAPAGSGARCTKPGCQTMSVPVSCKFYGGHDIDSMKCRTHQSKRQNLRTPFGGNGTPQIPQPAASYTIDRGSAICN